MQFSKIRFLSLLFTVLAMTTGFAHLFELPNKMKFSGSEYVTVQQTYRGWAFLGIIIFLAIAWNIVLVISVRGRPRELARAAVALAAILGTQVIFWIFTFPVNQVTNNWTVLPANWVQLRDRWEYSHAASAVLELVAVFALLLLPCRDSPKGHV